MESFDLIIIGAGPAGISAAVEAQHGGLNKILILEKGPSHSQMIRTYYKEGKRVDAQYAGQDAICYGLLCLKDGNRESYLSLMDHVIEQHKLEIRYNTEVWSVRKKDDGEFETMITGSEGALLSKSVVVAIGKMGKPNQPDYYKEVPGALKAAKRILFDITSRPIENEKVLVVGGGDSATEYVDMLSRNNQVTLSYRRTEFGKANAINQRIVKGLLSSGQARAYMPSNVTRIEDEGGKPKVHFAEAEFAPEVFDTVIYGLGGVNPVEFLKSAKVNVDDRGQPIVNEDFETSVPALYVVGDLLGKGRGGGSIIAGFNSAAGVARHLLRTHFQREVDAEYVTLDHLKF
jgi:thioredoxin reductase (NADPH)